MLARGAVLMHVARRDHRVGTDRKDRTIGRLIRIVLTRRSLRARYRALRAAVRDHGDFTQTKLNRGLRVGNMRHEGRSADLRAIEIFWLDAEIFRERQRPHAYLGRSNEQSIDVFQRKPTILERAD